MQPQAESRNRTAIGVVDEVIDHLAIGRQVDVFRHAQTIVRLEDLLRAGIRSGFVAPDRLV